MTCSRTPEVAMTNTLFTFSLPFLTFDAIILFTFCSSLIFLSYQHSSVLLYVETATLYLQHLRITTDIWSHGVLFIKMIYKLQWWANIHTLKNSKSTSPHSPAFLLLYHDFYVTSYSQVSGDADVNFCELIYVCVVLEKEDVMKFHSGY